jgi:hypothetical protein
MQDQLPIFPSVLDKRKEKNLNGMWEFALAVSMVLIIIMPSNFIRDKRKIWVECEILHWLSYQFKQGVLPLPISMLEQQTGSKIKRLMLRFW